MEAKANDQMRVTVLDEATGKSLSARIERLGDDLVVAVGGGERPHVGVVVLAQPIPSKSRPGSISANISVLTIPPHKEEPLARGIAEALCKAAGAVVVVSAGVHDDDLDAAGIVAYLDLGPRLAEELVRRVVGSK